MGNARKRTISGNSAYVLLDRALDGFQTDMTEEMFKAMSKAGKMAKRDIVRNSAERTGEYKKGWSIRTKRERYGVDVLVYNKTAPRLTHLLENGHVISNKYGSYGRVNGDHVIKKAQDAAEEYLLDILTQEL